MLDYFWHIMSNLSQFHNLLHGSADSLKMVSVKILFNFPTLQLGFRNFFQELCSSLLIAHYSDFLFTGPFDLAYHSI